MMNTKEMFYTSKELDIRMEFEDDATINEIETQLIALIGYEAFDKYSSLCNERSMLLQERAYSQGCVDACSHIKKSLVVIAS